MDYKERGREERSVPCTSHTAGPCCVPVAQVQGHPRVSYLSFVYQAKPTPPEPKGYSLLANSANNTVRRGSMRRSTSPQRPWGTKLKGNNVDDSEPDANRANHEPATQRYRSAQHACLTPCKRAQIPSSLSTRVPLGRSPPSGTGSTRRQNLLTVDASALKG